MGPAATEPDTEKIFQVHLLDMGAKKYGDCILLQIGRKIILIDGGHLGDQKRSHADYPSIPEQLEEILGEPPPWKVDLLVVTHAHSDHIGCLPNLVKNGLLTAAWVLAADEELGWGEVEGADAVVLADAPEPVRQVFALIREEPPSFASREELEAFASDAASQRANYTAMLKTLKEKGAKVVRYGKDSPAALLQAFRSTGLKILGPTREHLETCALQIGDMGRDAAEAVSASLERDASVDVAALYRELRDGGEGALEADSEGFSASAAINDQSLVLSFGTGERKVLLTGDMQFGGPGVHGLDDDMEALRRDIAAKGPYALVKLAHHGARNGADAAFLEETGANLFLISGGYGSSKHPHRSTVEALKALPQAVWYRTDRNGLISVDLAAEELEVGWERGEANDEELNPETRDFLDEEEEGEEEPARPVPAPAPRPQQQRAARAAAVAPDDFAAEAIYLMLHGRSSNGRIFLGATDDEELVEAFDTRNIRPCPGAVVFTGCCWGALIVETTAWTHEPGKGFAPRAPEASLALGFLAAGANAFVGCTGVHYSPRLKPYDYASGPLHRAFWKHLADGLQPAPALLAAKRSYLKGMPYPNPIPGEDPGAAAAAVEKKLLAQFVCLGLGW